MPLWSRNEVRHGGVVAELYCLSSTSSPATASHVETSAPGEVWLKWIVGLLLSDILGVPATHSGRILNTLTYHALNDLC